MTANIAYKVCAAADWETAKARGLYHGSPDDERDGFIHLSTAEQLRGTLDKHFAGQSDLLLIAFAATDLADKLKWETSRGGALFPHYYGALPVAMAAWTAPLPLDADGRHMLPNGI